MGEFQVSDLIVSVGIVAYNEEGYINTLFNQLLNQTYKKTQTEILLIDSLSTDETFNIFNTFKEEHKDEYKDIKVLKNEGKIQASGWNVAIDNFSGDVLIRVDAHTKLDKDFIKNNAECIMSGEMVCGGSRPNIAANDSLQSQLVLLSDNSLFGGSFGKYHHSTEKQYVDTVFHGCYRREVIEKVGHFNEKLGRTEDNDFHSRIREQGFKICYNPKILSYQFSRPTILSTVKQKFSNGLWIGKTLKINPKCISLFHLVPLVFVLALVFAVAFGFAFSFIPLILLTLAYSFVDLLLCLMSVISAKPFKLGYLLLIFMFPLLHISYGVGTILGIFSKCH